MSLFYSDDFRLASPRRAHFIVIGFEIAKAGNESQLEIQRTSAILPAS
jgi:hypothetical protein